MAELLPVIAPAEVRGQLASRVAGQESHGVAAVPFMLTEEACTLTQDAADELLARAQRKVAAGVAVPRYGRILPRG